MNRVTYLYNMEKDAWNVFRVLTQTPYFDAENLKRTQAGLPIELISEINSISDEHGKKEKIEIYLRSEFKLKGEFFAKKAQKFHEAWGKINDKYFNRLENILNIKIPPTNSYIGYLTSAGSCPFDAKDLWFMVRIADEKIDTVTAHEIMHIEFIRAYGYFCRDIGLSPKQFNAFRESITVLLNEEMADILFRPDYGYKEHEEYRKKIVDLWREKISFEDLIKESLKFIN